MLAEDQNLVRQGICNLLELSDSMVVVGQVDDGSEVVAGVERYQPDVILLDYQMPKMNGIEALQALQEAGHTTPAIILTTFDDHELLLSAVQAGARGFLLKDVSLESLVQAIETVHAGESLVQPAITERILKGLSGLKQTRDEQPLTESLSEKELEVLRLMAGGYSNREISLAVHKSEGTVKNQVSSILDKLDVRDRTQAVLRAINLGLL
jgi:DNA-binding NarL/FixJ family response regulator